MAARVDQGTMGLSWMEHQMLDHIKSALRVTINWTSPSVSYHRKLSSVQFAMKSFSRHMKRLMAIEEEDGYLKSVAEAKPNMQCKIASLREQHNHFRTVIEQLALQLDELQDWQESEFDRVCEGIRRLLIEVDQHDQSEIGLLQETLLSDEGGEG